MFLKSSVADGFDGAKHVLTIRTLPEAVVGVVSADQGLRRQHAALEALALRAGQLFTDAAAAAIGGVPLVLAPGRHAVDNSTIFR